MSYQPKTGQPCHCKRGIERDNCPDCEGTGMRIDFAAIRRRNGVPANPVIHTTADLERFAKAKGGQ